MTEDFYDKKGNVVSVEFHNRQKAREQGWNRVKTHNANGTSKRKPFNDRAGYVASKKNTLTDSSNVIYIAVEQGVDADGKYITVCEAHGNMISSTNIPDARIDMKDATEWCENCRALAGIAAPKEDAQDFDTEHLDNAMYACGVISGVNVVLNKGE